MAKLWQHLGLKLILSWGHATSPPDQNALGDFEIEKKNKEASKSK